MKFKIQYIIPLILLMNIQSIFSQKKDENIGTEVVNVVKPYTPTISDAFKIKDTPSLYDDETTQKEIIKYKIFEFPVASTFTPSKGKAAGVDKEKSEELYKNFITGGIGNYFTPLVELYVTENLGYNDYVAGRFNYLSSLGGIKDIPVNDGYLKSSLDITYGSKQSDFSWKADLGYQIQKYHWYGFPAGFSSDYTPGELNTIYDEVDNPQTYNNFYLGGKIKFNEGFFTGSDLIYDHFWDAFNVAENRFVATPSLQFDLDHQAIKTDIVVDYVGGTFDNYYAANTPTNYGFANFGITPSFAMQEADWSFDIGATILYSLDTENSNNKFYIYPQINASYKVVGDLMIFYTGVVGGLEQNSYRNFSNQNPFISPTLFITPTDKQYDFFAGLKGKVANSVSYNVKGYYSSEKNGAMFKSNNYDINAANPEFAFGNSFGVVYDDIKTLGFYSELKGDFSKNFSFGINGTFNSYTTGTQEEAWNLPELQFGANLDAKITPKWNAGIDLFFVGERKDMQVNTDILYPVAPSPITLDSYFDLNAHVVYKYNERISGFLRLNNITNQGYQKWLNYPVQSFQIMLGGNYKFDF